MATSKGSDKPAHKLRIEVDDGSDRNLHLLPHYFFACWVIFMLLLSSADFFKKIFQEHSQSVKGFGPRSDTVAPDLGPNCLQRLSAVDVVTGKERFKVCFYCFLVGWDKYTERYIMLMMNSVKNKKV